VNYNNLELLKTLVPSEVLTRIGTTKLQLHVKLISTDEKTWK